MIALSALCAAWTASRAPVIASRTRARPALCITSAVPSGVSELIEPAAISAAAAVEWTTLDLAADIASGPVEASFVRTTAATAGDRTPIVLLHSFDSSCMEWRRVLPLLDAARLEAYALCSLGWGFSDTSNVRSISVASKREHLRAFCEQVLGGRPALLVGSSLGAATIIDFVDACPSAVESVVMLDPQGFIDGAPPVPQFAARPGIQLLRSWPLRSFGQYIAYEDIPTFATDDAIRVGRLHCARDGWEDDQMQWLASGGYSVSSLVPRMEEAGIECLILWGRQDRVLPPAEYVPQFLTALPTRCTFRWVERCGHVPHLEQPAVTADAIAAFYRGETVAGDADVSALGSSPLEQIASLGKQALELEWRAASVTAEAITGAMRGEDAPASASTSSASTSSASTSSASAASSSPIDQLNAFLDRPLLDANERGGALEPLKKLIRAEPELAQVLASAFALSFFAAVGTLVGRIVSGTL